MPKKRVLVVDDDRPIRHLVRLVLSRSGFVVDEAGDGLEAIERLNEDGYSAVLLDLMMPRMSGFDVLDWLRGHDPQRLECVIVVTAAADRNLMGFDPTIVREVVRKPFDLSSLTAAVRRCVRCPDQTATPPLESDSN